MDDHDEYSKREIDVFLNDLRGSQSRVEVSLNEITQQTKKTNGSVAEVKGNLQFWKGYFTALGLVIVLVLIPMSGWLLVETYSMSGTLDKRISTAINMALINYGLIRH